MNGKTKRTGTLTALVLAAALMLTAATGVILADDDDPSGRIVAARGERETLSGTLTHEHGEWYLNSTWELHMGPLGHGDEQLFAHGAAADVDGFVFRNHIAPITVATNGETHEFWEENRMPRWAGTGEGGGRVAHTNPDIPTGNRAAVDAPQRQFLNSPPGLGRNRN